MTKNAGRPFYVRTTDINIKVLGTKFNVKSYPDEDIIETTLISGEVEIQGKVEKRNATALKLYPDQKATFSKKERVIRLQDKTREIRSQPSAVKPVNILKTDELIKKETPRIEICWKENLLVFNDEPLESLERKLERWYGVEIELEGRNVKNLRFTGTIANETIEQAMKALKIASDIDYEIDKKKIRIWKKR